MDLDQYLSSHNALTVSQLRERLVSLGYQVKSDAQIRQWQHQYAGRLPSPENCVGLELASDGRISRRDLRPDDWQRIWPELSTTSRNRRATDNSAIAEGTPIDGKSVREARGKFRIPKIDTRKLRE